MMCCRGDAGQRRPRRPKGRGRLMAYLIFMLRHKWFVFLECLKLGVPIWRAIIHDWDKIFAPHTFIAFKRRYDQGNDHYKMANNSAYQMAYHLHCNRRHKHHWQWWIRDRKS